MALFCSRAERSAEADALEAEVERLDQLPVPALAAAVMSKAFGPGAEWEDPEEEVTVGGSGGAGATVGAIAAAMAPDDSSRWVDESDRLRLERLVAEGVQALEHASLVRAQVHSATAGFDYTPTRLGRKVLASGFVAEVVGGGDPAG